MIKFPDPVMIFPDEKILYSTGYHWIYVARSSWPLALTLVIGTLLWAVLPHRATSLLIMIALIASATWVIMKVIDTMIMRCFITNRRLINRTGLTSRDTKYVTLDRIGGMLLDQTPMERFLGYGRVKLIVPLIEIKLPEYLSNPIAFRNALSAAPAAAAKPAEKPDEEALAVAEEERLAKEQDDRFGAETVSLRELREAEEDLEGDSLGADLGANLGVAETDELGADLGSDAEHDGHAEADADGSEEN
ncbi:MAG: PH domain-containing protein [Alphaproteobacteria bacterium]